MVSEHGSAVALGRLRATTNRRLGGRKVSWLWVGGFKIVGDLVKNARARATNQNENSFEISQCIELSGHWDLNPESPAPKAGAIAN